MEFGIAMCLAVSMLLGADAKNDSAPNDNAFQGVWQLSSGEVNGKALSATQLQGGKLIIDGDQYIVTLADLGTVTGTQKLGGTPNFPTIDITDATGPHQGKTCLGIYEIDGDELRVAFASPGGVRPSKFESSAENAQWTHVWKRVQE